MQPYTATDMLYVIKTEYRLDELSARALVQSSLDAPSNPRRSLRARMHSVFTLLF